MSGSSFEMLHLDRLPPPEHVDLRGRYAAVTGGAGPNLGQAIVHRLAGLGASVAILHRAGKSAAAARQVVSDAAERWGATVVAIEADVSDWDAAHRAAHQVVEALGGLDIWVNNAGGSFRTLPFADLSREELDGILEGYLTPTVYGTHAALQVMLPQKHGRIINISSGAAYEANPNLVTYGVAKAGVNALSEFLGSEIGPQGVTIAGVAAGSMIGQARREAIANYGEEALRSMAEAVAKKSIGRYSSPEEVANMVAFLATDAGAYVHGTTIRMTG